MARQIMQYFLEESQVLAGRVGGLVTGVGLEVKVLCYVDRETAHMITFSEQAWVNASCGACSQSGTVQMVGMKY
jgi:hypothetical protein